MRTTRGANAGRSAASAWPLRAGSARHLARAALAELAPDASLPVAGKLVASKDLQALLQAHVDTINALNDARAKLSQLVARATFLAGP